MNRTTETSTEPLCRRENLPSSLSIVIPCYNEQEVLPRLVERLSSVLNRVNTPAEVILVDDGSRDRTWQMMVDINRDHPEYRIVRLSRNYGHQTALSCGLELSSGQIVLIMDADLQDPPELLPEMIKHWQNGFDVVYGKRTTRSGESKSKRIFAYSFYRIIQKLTNIKIPEDTGDFRLMDRKAVDALLQLKERHRFIRGMIAWIGYRQCPIYYDRPERAAGNTKYPFKKSFLLAVDAITSFSIAPLRLAIYLGTILSVIALLYINVVVVLWFLDISFPGYSSLMGSILLLGGVQLLVLGIIGEYVGRIFEQGQNRPLYLIDEVIGQPLEDFQAEEPFLSCARQK